MNKFVAPGIVVFLALFLGSALWFRWQRDQVSRTPFDADAYLARSLAAAKQAAPDGELASLVAGYVDPDGKIHPELRGSLHLRFRAPSHPDATAKPILGAPPPRGQSKCPRLDVRTYPYSGGKARHLVELETGWRDDDSCGPSLPAPLRCTVAAIWKRALADGAPHPAYADVSLETRDGHRVWQFKITDRSNVLENVVFRREYPDDCR